jgi:predicted nucleotidyltransferase component of viral defense system
VKGIASPQAHSALERLKNKKPSDTNQTLKRYGNERFLYRLSQSPYRDRFVLKGGALFQVWSGQMHRSTKDIDFLGFGDSREMESIFKSLCQASPDDQLLFDPDTVSVSHIKGQGYPGVQVTLVGYLGTARIPLRFDVGFGDITITKPLLSRFPVLLDEPPPVLLIYPIEAVIAEKLHAIQVLDMLNSRVKDFFDIWYASNNFGFKGRLLFESIKATFERRDTPLPVSLPQGLSDNFVAHQNGTNHWKMFLKTCPDGNLEFGDVVKRIRLFLAPVIQDRVSDLEWQPDKGWVE